jgi:hypothetical protein
MGEDPRRTQESAERDRIRAALEQLKAVEQVMGKNPGSSQESTMRDYIRAVVRVRVMLTLRDLGATGDAIASALKEQGIAGRRGNPRECPVAHYLRLNLGLQGVLVFAGLLKNADAPVVLPAAVRDFVERFDAGAYAELAIPSQRKRRVGPKAPRKNTAVKPLTPGSESGEARPTGGAC